MKKGIAMVLAILMVGSVFLVGCAKKDDSLTKIKDAGVLVLGLDDSFPPMGFRDDKNNIVGFDIDLAKEVTTRMGVELKLQPIDWDSNVIELNSGNIDCIWNGLTITAERQKQMIFSDAYMKNRQVIVVRADSNISTLADLAGKKLCLQAGSSAADALNSHADFKNSLGQVIELSDNVTAFMELEGKTSDAILMDEIVAAYNIKKDGSDLKILDESLADEVYGVGFRKDDVTLRDEVNKQLKAMAADGTLAEISNKWFGKDITVIK
jgi:polar amino acid transport system substrate-binding protein